MRLLLAFAAALVVCAGPALAQADRPVGGCEPDPETTGTLPLDPRSLHLPGERSDRALDRVEVTPSEESWQDEAQEDAERRRRGLLACGVD